MMYDLVCKLTGDVVAQANSYSEAVELQYAYKEVENVGLDIVELPTTNRRELTEVEKMTLIY